MRACMLRVDGHGSDAGADTERSCLVKAGMPWSLCCYAMGHGQGGELGCGRRQGLCGSARCTAEAGPARRCNLGRSAGDR